MARRDAPRHLDAVDAGHHDIGEQQIVIAVVSLHESGLAVRDRVDRMAGTPQPAAEKSAQLIIVFGEKDPRHGSETSSCDAFAP